jgi:F0F1-type ATP synthase epsilon subunit
MWEVIMALTVEIVTPTSVAYSGEANEVLAPGFLGEFGILPEHTLYLPSRLVW